MSAIALTNWLKNLKLLRFTPSSPQIKSSSIKDSCAAILGNETGSITLMGALTLSALTLYLFYQLLFARHSLTLMQERSDTYLCYRQFTTYSKMYVEIMATTNLAIDTAIGATVISLGALAPKTAMIIRQLMQLQDLFHVWIVQKLSFSSYCSLTQKAILIKNLPYRTVGAAKLKRTFFNVVVRKKKWHVYLPSNLSRVTSDPMEAFALKIELKLAGFFDPFLSYKGSEVSAGQFLKWNSPSGWSLSL